MGYMRHNAIIVTGFQDDAVQLAHDKAVELFHFSPNLTVDRIAEVSEITPISINGYSSFFVAPDGSKEGWNHSDAGDDARDKFINCDD